MVFHLGTVCSPGLTRECDASQSNSVLEIGHDERITVLSNVNKSPNVRPHYQKVVACLDGRDLVGIASDRQIIVVESS